MPSEGGVTKGKVPYMGMEISLYSTENSTSQSSGMGWAEGEVYYRWTLEWDESGFTSKGWDGGPGIDVDYVTIGTVFAETKAAIARYRSQNQMSCATYERLDSSGN